ncbi:tRNA1(Val) (adenine(37)-N6)-methyltransferase [Deferribacterales bacterium RsTz2092]|nr:SAM-dependent methyltransferase [Deferribacterales bacterium]
MSIDYIISQSLQISQPDEGFRFGSDSLVLAWFATVKPKERIIDICSGSGVLSVLLAERKQVCDIVAVELQDEMFKHLEDTININKLGNVIKAVHQDIKTYKPDNEFNMAICNPPYRAMGSGRLSSDTGKQQARFDVELSLDELLAFCKKYIFFGGRLALSGVTDRLATTINACISYNFEPKKLAFLYPAVDRKPKIFFLECAHGALSGGLQVCEPIVQNTALYEDIINGRW